MEKPAAKIDPLSQVVVAADASGKGSKRGRKGDDASTSNKIQKLNEDVAVEEVCGAQEGVVPPPARGNRSSRRRPAGPNKTASPEADVAASEAVEKEGFKGESPPIWDSIP
jgi:hypothetical protein